ncbi:phosphopantetheine-binding protein [Streptomyces sp. NPDC050485]|uniref:phosphopantetheine-binding protein n=1 Tax=Streptomyces sp. NPDC050485 TaxID=3365617 RepID=UPI0037BC8B00
MPDTTTTEQILRTALATAATTGADTIPDNGHLERDLGIDSLALAELVTILEQRLTLTIPDEETGRLQTVADVRALLARLIPSSGTDPTL